MLWYALRRIAGLVPTLLVIITVSFFVVRLAPGGPFDQEQTLAPQVRANLDRAYGLHRPIAVQYWRYLRGLAHGDFGPSFKQHDFSVTELISQGLPVSGSLGITAILLAILLGIPSGLAAALWRQTAVDYGISSLVVLGMALPAFVIGPVLALVFGVYLQWLPVVSYLGPATAFVVTGSLVVETVFGLPGTGRYLVQGAINRDYTLVMGMVIVYGTLVLLLNLIADLAYGWLDPRVRHE